MNSTSSLPLGDDEAEVTSLIATLHVTGQRLDELAGGEVDAMADGAGRTFLLQRAKDGLLHDETGKQAAVLNALSAHIVLLDADGVIVSVNEAWRQLATANSLQGPEFAVGTNYLEVCDQARGDDAAEAHQTAEGIRSVLAGRKRFSLEYPCHSPQQLRWFQMTVTPIVEPDARGAVVMHEDITERKLAENTVRESQTTMAAAQQIGHFGSWEIDLLDTNDVNANVLRWSDEMFRIAGYEPGAVEVTNRFFFSRVPPEEHEAVRQGVERAIRERKQYSQVHRLIRADGETRVVQETAQIYYEAHTGRPLKIIGTAHDITDRLAVQDALNRERNLLLESEAHFRMLTALGDAMRPLASPEEIMAVATRMLGEHLGASRCAYADVDGDGERFSIRHDYTDGCASTLGNYQLSHFGVRAVTTLNQGQTLIVRNVDAELSPGEGADTFNAIGIKAIITCPLVKENGLRAMMAVHQSLPRDWLPCEIAIVQEVARRCWATIERQVAEEKLRKSEALLRIAGRTAKLGGWSLELPEFRTTWSDEVCAIHEMPPGTVPTLEQAIGFYTPESLATIKQAVGACAEQGTPFDLELDIITAKGNRIGVRSIGRGRAKCRWSHHGTAGRISRHHRGETHRRKTPSKREALQGVVRSGRCGGRADRRAQRAFCAGQPTLLRNCRAQPGGVGGAHVCCDYPSPGCGPHFGTIVPVESGCYPRVYRGETLPAERRFRGVGQQDRLRAVGTG